jgi:hypothetical protein
LSQVIYHFHSLDLQYKFGAKLLVDILYSLDLSTSFTF